MRLLRYGQAGAEKPAILDDSGKPRDLSGVISDISPITLGDATLNRLRDLKPGDLPSLPSNSRIGPCVGNVGKLVCVGLNYTDHAAEAGLEKPPEPILFMKSTTAICGPYDNIVIPPNALKVDWEIELGIVIGEEARYVSERQALEHIAGYCIVNDISERSFQMERAGQWMKGKSADTFGPIGPYLVTRDAIKNPQDLSLWLEVDGQTFQKGTTAKMIFEISFLVSYISQFMTLLPGDIIATGTPAGVGMGQNPPVYLRPNNRLRLGIDGLGEQCQLVTAQDSNM